MNLNNQTTYNINTASNTNMNVNMDLETIKSNNYKKIEENNTRSFVSKTPEGLQRRGKRIILTNNSYMKPYLKKNAILSNKNSTHDNGLRREESNNMEKIKVNELNKNISYSDITQLKNKRINYSKYNNINKENNTEKNQNFNTEIGEKEKYKILLNQLQRENENLKIENKKYKNQQNIKNINRKETDDY